MILYPSLLLSFPLSDLLLVPQIALSLGEPVCAPVGVRAPWRNFLIAGNKGDGCGDGDIEVDLVASLRVRGIDIYHEREWFYCCWKRQCCVPFRQDFVYTKDRAADGSVGAVASRDVSWESRKGGVPA